LLQLQRGDLHAAEAEFREAVRLKAGYAEAHYNLGLALHQDGREAESGTELEKAYAIAPGLRSLPRP